MFWSSRTKDPAGVQIGPVLDVLDDEDEDMIDAEEGVKAMGKGRREEGEEPEELYSSYEPNPISWRRSVIKAVVASRESSCVKDRGIEGMRAGVGVEGRKGFGEGEGGSGPTSGRVHRRRRYTSSIRNSFKSIDMPSCSSQPLFSVSMFG